MGDRVVWKDINNHIPLAAGYLYHDQIKIQEPLRVS